MNDPFAYAIALHRDNMLLTLTKLSLLVGISLGLVGFGACDGGIHVKGRVYAQKGSAGDSQAFIDQSAQSGFDVSISVHVFGTTRTKLGETRNVNEAKQLVETIAQRTPESATGTR